MPWISACAVECPRSRHMSGRPVRICGSSMYWRRSAALARSRLRRWARSPGRRARPSGSCRTTDVRAWRRFSMAAEAVTPGRLISLAPEALDFAPDLLALQERPPSRMPRAIAVTLVTLILLLLAWACFFKLDIVASAEGRLVPLSFTKVVQPADSGVVAEILVADGQAVQAGQLLMRMDERLSAADTTALKKDVALRRLTLRRIDAEMADRAMLPSAGDPADLYAQVEGQFRA